VDIDPLTRNIDLNRIEAAIAPATRALLPVDLAGLPVDRQFLHASGLGFQLPDGRAVAFFSPLPTDLQAILDALRDGERR
jgi:hypothetical protein